MFVGIPIWRRLQPTSDIIARLQPCRNISAKVKAQQNDKTNMQGKSLAFSSTVGKAYGERGNPHLNRSHKYERK
ncbi:MAG: hypothetical protein J6Y72_03900 [Bacteroidales bacterium]|nr:hypothetical protein [Bacteroidales bacterium]